MSKKISVVSSSLRADSNSDLLAEAFMYGAREAGGVSNRMIGRKSIRFFRRQR